jgi:hypothetical protein
MKEFRGRAIGPEGSLAFAGGPNLSEIAGAGDRLSLSGLHETGDETVLRWR